MAEERIQKIMAEPVSYTHLFAGSAAHCKLHGHDGQAQNDEEDQVEQHERAAAALTGNIRELPHVANADGTAR